MTEFLQPWKSMNDKTMAKWDLEKILLEGLDSLPEYKHLLNREVWWTWYEKQIKKTFVLRLHETGLYEAIDISKDATTDHRITLNVNLKYKKRPLVKDYHGQPIVEDNIYELIAPDFTLCKIIKENIRTFDEFDEARKYFMYLCDSYKEIKKWL